MEMKRSNVQHKWNFENQIIGLQGEQINVKTTELNCIQRKSVQNFNKT